MHARRIILFVSFVFVACKMFRCFGGVLAERHYRVVTVGNYWHYVDGVTAGGGQLLALC
jgi:heme/copper-type cytochrome/quinol oxidase subunit 3